MAKYMRFTGVALTLLFGVILPAGATEYYVSSFASSNGNGSRSNPWLINTALGSSAVQPGDTVTLDGGTYVNPTNGQDHDAFNCSLIGTSSRPIIVRAAPGQSVVLDGADSQQNDILRINGSYVWVWGLEVYSSSPNRYSPSGGSFPPVSEIQRGYCIAVSQGANPVGVKVINCILHDGFGGFDAWSTSGTELYGCVLYNNGWLASDRNHGHNIYIQNVAGSQRAINSCITWGAFENLVQAYGTQNTDDFTFDENISFMPIDGGFLVGGAVASKNLKITNSYFYSSTTSSPLLNLGWNPYGGGLANATITGNYFGGGELLFQKPITGNISGNSIYYGYMVGGSPVDFPNNVWTSSAPTTNKIVVIPNKYEPGRANIAVYNWTHASTVQVDLSAVLNTGDQYTIIDAQNPSGIVASGSYSGPASISMNGLQSAQPIGSGQGQSTRTHTTSEFGSFIVLAKTSSAAATVKVVFDLQGPYVSSTGTMANTLNKAGLLASHFGVVSRPSSAVDSVNIEIRNSAAVPTMRAFVPCWLMTDGSIRDFADTTKTYVRFPGVTTGDYYVVVRHRNHIGVMSSVRVSANGTPTPTAYDFTIGQGQAYGTNAMIGTGNHYSLISGLASDADQVINAIDRVVSRNSAGANDYNLADVNMDGVVNALDRIVERTNLGLIGQVPQ